jgi:DNA modification methylase
MSDIKLYQGDCLEVMKQFSENSIDAICCDPPYGLSFMGKKWDYDVPSVEIWQECLRVLKPGGYLLSFAGTRTQHRMAVRIEDAGFEIRDMIAWVYSTGFPKSLNIEKQLTKMYGTTQKSEHNLRPMRETDLSQEISNSEAEGEILQSSVSEQGISTSIQQLSNNERGKESSLERRSDLLEKTRELQTDKVCEVSEEVSENGEERRIHNGTPIDNGEILETNIGESGSSASYQSRPTRQQDKKPNAFSKQQIAQAIRTFKGWGTALKPALEPITVARKPLAEKTVALNCLKWGVGGINIDGCRVEYQGKEDFENTLKSNTGNIAGGTFKCSSKSMAKEEVITSTGRFPANLIHSGEDEVVELFPNTKPTKPHGGDGGKLDTQNMGWGFKRMPCELADNGGSAARFFMTCKYTPKDAILKLCEDNIPANNAVISLPITSLIEVATNIASALKSVPPNLDLVNRNLNVLFAEKKSTNTAIDFVAKLVAMSEAPEVLVSQEELTAIQDFIGSSKKCSQTQKNVSAEKSENTDITQITINLLKLSGYVQLAIEGNTNLERKEVAVENGEHRRFLYQAKASKSERNRGCEELEEKTANKNGQGLGRECSLESRKSENGDDLIRMKNNHPTVKPISLMEYLIKLVSREGHTILDPFAGSFTTGIACINLDRKFIGIERDEEYLKIGRARIDYALNKKKSSLFSYDKTGK